MFSCKLSTILKGICWEEQGICKGDLGETARFSWILCSPKSTRPPWGLKPLERFDQLSGDPISFSLCLLTSYFSSNLPLYLVAILKGPKIPIQLRPLKHFVFFKLFILYWKWKWSRSVVSNWATPWAVAHRAPPSMGFSGKSTGVGCNCLRLSEDHGLIFLSSQVVLVVKNLPANASDTRDLGSIPGSGRSRKW